MSISIILCLITSTYVTSQKQVHRVFVSRESRSDSAPIETGYMYNRVDNNPGTLSVFGSDRTTSEPVLESYSELKKFLSPIQYHPIDFTKQIYRPDESPLAKRDLDHAIAKSKSKAYFLPSILDTDQMYERLKSTMHYQPDDLNEMVSRYDNSEYHSDDGDIRTSSRDVYDNWPSYHHNPYEYEHMKIQAEVEKAKDKRYAVDKLIPVHEDLIDDIPNSYEHVFTTDNYQTTTTDNPMTGHDPFFSFILNDYYDKNNFDDHLSFRGLDWGKEFDNSRPITDIDDYSRRNRRLENSYHTPVDHGTTSHSNSHINHGQDEIKTMHSDSVTEKGFNTEHEFDKYKKGDKEKLKDKTNYNLNEQKHTGFKNFVDSFANKFGAEDHKKDSKFVFRKNQDNGEKKKGFHRVYHKDEYQEDNEFYNNKDNSAMSEEKGSSNTHIGGSEGLLSSHASALLGNQSHSYNKAGNSDKTKFQNNHSGHDNTRGIDGHFNRYRDVAKQAAQSNNADYSDHYKI